MKTETLTIPASQLRIGDVIDGRKITQVKVGAITWIKFKGKPSSEYPFQNDYTMQVSRIAARPFPRGLMEWGTCLKIGGQVIPTSEFDEAKRMIAARWNWFEKHNNEMTTEEIEASDTKDT